jgi:hypothetical protein
MDNQAKMSTSSTKDTGRRQTTQKTQQKKIKR